MVEWKRKCKNERDTCPRQRRDTKFAYTRQLEIRFQLFLFIHFIHFRFHLPNHLTKHTCLNNSTVTRERTNDSDTAWSASCTHSVHVWMQIVCCNLQFFVCLILMHFIRKNNLNNILILAQKMIWILINHPHRNGTLAVKCIVIGLQ